MLFSLDIGIDLGTANTLVFVKGKGIVIREPSVVAVDQKYNPPRVVAVGTEAKEMIGRTPGSITAVRPLKDGVIADFDITADMLKAFIKKVAKSAPLAKVRVMICIPSGVTGVERNAVNDAARSAGAKYVSLIEEPMAAAIGASVVQWLVTGYLLLLSVSIPSSPFMVSKFATKTLFIMAIVIFIAGTLLGALAVNFPMLLAARLVMSLGTGISLPLITNIHWHEEA